MDRPSGDRQNRRRIFSCYGASVESPLYSVWLFDFYGAHFAGGYTLPKDAAIVDTVGYFASTTIYKNLVFFIYNKANKQIDSSFIDALESINPVVAVLIVPGVKT
jgi:hypothetical protein